MNVKTRIKAGSVMGPEERKPYPPNPPYPPPPPPPKYTYTCDHCKGIETGSGMLRSATCNSCW